MNPDVMRFVERQLPQDEVQGRRIVEVGSQDVNGSVRALLERHSPAGYLGVDMMEGPGVDEVVDAERLVDRFGPESFDVVVTTEMLEHVVDWRSVVSNLKQIVRPGGVLLATTRSRFFPFHAWPHDVWRYEVEDFTAIFGDFQIEALERDPGAPGVFMRARRPQTWEPASLNSIKLWSILTRTRGDIVGPEIPALADRARKRELARSRGERAITTIVPRRPGRRLAEVVLPRP